MEAILDSNEALDFCPTCNLLDNASTFENSTQDARNSTADGITSWSTITLMCLASVFLALIILSTIIGNVLVIVAVFIDKNLQNVANRLIVSLAVADLMVALFVMGPAAHYMISGSWHFGAIGCDLWTSVDVLSCSASILHLLAVALDRYLAVSTINWTVNRNSNTWHINLMILMVWLVAFLVSVAPLLGWKDKDFWERIEENRICMINQDLGYQLFASLSTFYIPTALILLLYWKIWQTAKTRIRHRVGKANNHHKAPPPTVRPTGLSMPNTLSADELSCHVETSSELVSPEVQEMASLPVVVPNDNDIDADGGINPSAGPSESQLSLKPPSSPYREPPDISINPPQSSNLSQRSKIQKRKESLESKRERKAAKTLAIITGAFMICWLPFFVMVLILALCSSHCNLPEYIANAFQWLGYLNSTINPGIYTVFNPEFRNCFKKILFGSRGNNPRR